MRIVKLAVYLHTGLLALSLNTVASTFNIHNQASSATTEFALSDLKAVLEKNGHSIAHGPCDFTISIELDTNLAPQTYAIAHDQNVIRIIGGDRPGLMYGLLDLAEQFSFGTAPENIKPARKQPFIGKRGVKFNIPLDARLPSYDDTGDAAQSNIEEMWSLDFWHAYLDDLARNRYNVLSLWTKHPFPAMIKLKDFPDVAMDDVYVFNKELKPEYHKDLVEFNLQDPKNLKLVKRMTIDEKIAFWQHVMQYAYDRGIDIYFFTWNIYVIGAEKHGISDFSDSAVDYMRECVRTFAETYPHLAGMGVTAGEHMDQTVGKRTNVQWLYDTYGRGIGDVLKTDPDRDIRFIFRANSIRLDDVDRDFRNHFPGDVDTSYKCSGPHMYSTPVSPGLSNGFGKDMQRLGFNCWLNMRNDDFYVYRWGDPDYARAYLKNAIQWPLAGFYIGSDGYVWGREHISTVPELSGQLENGKHWYREMIWGRLAYDPTLDQTFFKQRLATRFPETDPEALYAAWQAASGIVPLVNRFFWKGGDSMFHAESCTSLKGFIGVRDLIDGSPNNTSAMSSIIEYTEELQQEKPSGRTSPFEVADQLMAAAQSVLAQVEAFKTKTGKPSMELQDTLADLEAMAWMGAYYGQKIQGATHLHLHESLPEKSAKKAVHRDSALDCLHKAESSWKNYAAASTPRYKPQLLARTHYMDWNARLADVANDIRTVEMSTGKPPRVVKLFMYSKNFPKVVEQLKKAFAEKGWKPEEHQAWQWKSYSNFELAILTASEGSDLFKSYQLSGGIVPESYDREGYALAQNGRYIWVLGKDMDSLKTGLSELAGRMEQDKPLAP